MFSFPALKGNTLLRVAAMHEDSVESSEVGEDARHDGRKSRVIGDLVDSVRQLALQLVEGVFRRPPNGAVRWARLHAVPCLLNQVGHARVEVRGEVVMHEVALLAACYGRRECRDNRGHVGLIDLYRSPCHLGQAPPLRPTRRNSQNECPLFTVPVYAGCADAHRRNALAVGAIFFFDPQPRLIAVEHVLPRRSEHADRVRLRPPQARSHQVVWSKRLIRSRRPNLASEPDLLLARRDGLTRVEDRVARVLRDEHADLVRLSKGVDSPAKHKKKLVLPADGRRHRPARLLEPPNATVRPPIQASDRRSGQVPETVLVQGQTVCSRLRRVATAPADGRVSWFRSWSLHNSTNKGNYQWERDISQNIF